MAIIPMPKTPEVRFIGIAKWWNGVGRTKNHFLVKKTPFMQGLEDANGDYKEAEVHIVPDEDKNEAKSKSLGQNNPTKDGTLSEKLDELFG